MAGNYRHGMFGTPEYRTWERIVQRCYNPKHVSYQNYGGRGITVCDRWRKSFTNFLLDMGKKPDGYSLDRTDNNGNYEPGNCRWVDFATQCNNRRSNVMLTLINETKTMTEWANDPRCKVGLATFSQRIRRLGWDIDKALSTPSRQGGIR